MDTVFSGDLVNVVVMFVGSLSGEGLWGKSPRKVMDCPRNELHDVGCR